MTPTTKKILVSLALIALGIAIGLSIAFATQRMMDAREVASDKEKFDQDFKAMAEWFENYKRENPAATDEDTKRAFEEIWKK